MQYKTYKPSHSLAPWIKCFWSLEAPAEDVPIKQRIVPDGCMEMIFHCGEVYAQYQKDGTCILQPRSFVFGQIGDSLEIQATGITNILAARFHPEGFAPFTSMTLGEMKNKAIPLVTLFGEAGNLLEEKVIGVTDNHKRIQYIESFLWQQLKGEETMERMIRPAVEVLMRLKGQVSVGELADQLKISRRQLERKFSKGIGLSPKQLSKIIRLQAGLKMLEQKQFTSLTDLAYDSGYFDQAHFIRDFKAFTGMSPKQFYAGNLKMSSLFIGQE